jgi:HAD superfamily hydrolase (TIGR01549 family)
MKPFKFIFFDVGNTLLFANRERMLAPLHQRRIRVPEELLLAVERRTKREFDDILERGGTADHGFWDVFYTRLFEDLVLNDEAVRQELIANTRLSSNWDRMRPGTREALVRFSQQWPIAVISNSDGKIADLLLRCGIGDCFRTITDSGIMGREKPHPEIFAAALKSMDAKAQDSLYVGDVYAVDYRGATQAGMQAVLFDAAGAYRDKGLPRVESLQELHTLLGQVNAG